MFHCLGVLTSVVFGLYAVLYLLHKCSSHKFRSVKSKILTSDMPVLRPLPIATNNLDTWLDKVLAVIFTIRRWQVEKAFIYEHRGTRYVVSACFDFDGASIPKFLWTLASPVGLLLIPGLLHDYGYRYNGIYVLDENDNPVWDTTINNKEGWDLLFKDVGDEVNKLSFLNTVAWLAVDLGGSGAWNKWRRANQSPKPFEWSCHIKCNEAPQQSPTTSQEPDTEFESGTTKTTVIGYMNPNNQKVHGTRKVEGTDHNQVAYKVECLDCNEVYGANGSELYRRKCPSCQDGKSGINY